MKYIYSLIIFCGLALFVSCADNNEDAEIVSNNTIEIEGDVSIFGQFIDKSTVTSLSGYRLYLGGISTFDNNDEEYVITMQLNESPSTPIFDDGSFKISNVPSGKYIPIIWSIGGSSVVKGLDGKELVVEIIADQVIDIGVVEVDSSTFR